jgi:hypothetical protein
LTGTCALAAAALLQSCGGGTGTERDSGVQKVTLSVAASDPDGDALHHEWRVTGGTVENRDAAQTVWTLPPGPGLHFAYVLVTDGKGGYVQQQYAVSTDALNIDAPARAATRYPIETVPPASEGNAFRLRLSHPGAPGRSGALRFDTATASGERQVYLPDVAVRVSLDGTLVHAGVSNARGEVNLPQLLPGRTYTLACALAAGGPFTDCRAGDRDEQDLGVDTQRASVVGVTPSLPASHNLRLHGHVSMADDTTCGRQDEYFGIQAAATVQLLQADGQALSAKRRVNAFGDYAISSPAAVDEPLTLRIECGNAVHDEPLRPDNDAATRAALLASAPLERSHRFDNRPPRIERLVAIGNDGSVRGRMVEEEAPAVSNGLPGRARFLAYKGTDSALSACLYYRAIGAVADCDGQGRLLGAITLDDWRRHHGFAPFAQGEPEVSALYINQRDLSLVRHMTAKRTGNGGRAFYVCNNPGPEGRSQEEVDRVVDFGAAGERRVACVAMEWTQTPNVNGDQPFTKFLTFGPDGHLIASVNLDGRGEKYMPGACIACHGGSRIGGRFPESGRPSPMLGARFLPFDTGNYLFSSRSEFTEAGQSAAFHELNRLVAETEGGGDTPTRQLIAGWYRHGGDTLDKDFVPGDPTQATGWRETPDKAAFYREVVGSSCRTCHTGLGSHFNWDGQPNRFDGTDSIVKKHVCGGTPDVAVNASMPNALASLNRLLVDHPPGSPLRQRMATYLGCSEPSPDPVYPRR